MKVWRFIVGLTLGLFVAAPVMAQQPVFLSKHGAWTAHVTNSDGRKTCFAWTKPTKSQISKRNASRGDVLAFVTIFNPAPSGPNYYPGGQISVVTGYPYLKDAAVQANIGKKRFELMSEDDTAWPVAADDDKKLIGAMKAGSTMVVRGTSTRKTKTTDTYSLKGFTAAYNAIVAACK